MAVIPTVPILPGAAHFDAPHGVATWPPEPDGMHFGKRFWLMTADQRPAFPSHDARLALAQAATRLDVGIPTIKKWIRRQLWETAAGSSPVEVTQDVIRVLRRRARQDYANLGCLAASAGHRPRAPRLLPRTRHPTLPRRHDATSTRGTTLRPPGLRFRCARDAAACGRRPLAVGRLGELSHRHAGEVAEAGRVSGHDRPRVGAGGRGDQEVVCSSSATGGSRVGEQLGVGSGDA